jgi:peptidyl-prolyl cis-trans isomerase D
MLKAMRQNTKIILWIILAAFVGTIIFTWGMNVTGRRGSRQAVVGVVNGQEISYQQFSYIFQNLYDQTQEQLGQALDPETSRQLLDEAWNQIVSQILLGEEIEKRKIRVTDLEVITYIRDNPPDFLLNNESLQTDGQFDPQKYAAALADPRYDWRPLENQVRAILPVQKLQSMIMAAVRVTDGEVWNDYRAKNERVQVRYVAFQPTDFEVDQAKITEGEIRHYFEEHRQEYHQPSRANLDYVFLEKVASPADEDTVRAELEAIRERAMEGEDFGELAEIFSQGPSGKDGGDLGFFGRGVMDSAFEAGAFALQEGEISTPVRSSFGWHIIKLEERRASGTEEEVRARHILLKVTPSQQTLEALLDQVNSLAQRAKELGLEEATQEAGFEVAQTGLFHEGSQFVPGLGRASDAAKFAFSSKRGEIGGPFENEKGLYLVSIQEREKAGVPPLDKVKKQVESAFIREKQKQLAGEKAMGFQNRLQEGQTLASAAQDVSLFVEETEPFARKDYVPKIGLANEFVGTAFGLQVGQISGLVETNRGYYFLQVVAREEVDQEEFQEQKQALTLDLLRRKQNQVYGDWFEAVRRKASIEDYRDRFFRV